MAIAVNQGNEASHHRIREWHEAVGVGGDGVIEAGGKLLALSFDKAVQRGEHIAMMPWKQRQRRQEEADRMPVRPPVIRVIRMIIVRMYPVILTRVINVDVIPDGYVIPDIDRRMDIGGTTKVMVADIPAAAPKTASSFVTSQKNQQENVMSTESR